MNQPPPPYSLTGDDPFVDGSLPTLNTVFRPPDLSASQPLLVNSNAPSPVCPITVHSNAPLPVRLITVHSNAPLPVRPITIHSSPAPILSVAQSTAVTPVRLGTRSHPVVVGSSPAPVPSSAQFTAMTPATQETRNYTVVVGNPPALASVHPNTPASNRSSQTPTPLSPRRTNPASASAARLRAIEDALEEYTTRNGHDVPSPRTPSPVDVTPEGLEARLDTVEECLNDLLTREAAHASAADEWRNKHAIAVATLAFERCRNRMISEGQIIITSAMAHQQDGCDPTPPLDSRDPTPSDGRDVTPPSTPLAGLSTGPGTAAYPTTPVAGSSTGPGTTASPTLPDSQERDWFKGYKDYTPTEAAELEAMLNAKGY